MSTSRGGSLPHSHRSGSPHSAHACSNNAGIRPHSSCAKHVRVARHLAHASVVGSKLELPSTNVVPQDGPPAVVDQQGHVDVVSPESFQLQPGELGPMLGFDESTQETYRCAGCTALECQGESGCAKTQWRFSLDGYLRQILTARVYDVAIESPLEHAPRLSEQMDNKILLKREDLQPVFSFKLRGAYNKMANLTEAQLQRGVICSSAGNHAQGVALAAQRLGTTAVICMPVTTPDIKVKAVRRLGGIVELVGESYSETQHYAQQRALRDDLVFVAPYDDPYTIAGQGTIAMELLRQASTEDIHAIFVAIGGGGLIAGVAAYIKALRPDIKIVGVEPTGANAMAQSLARGHRVTLSKVDVFADGVAVKTVGVETFRLCQQLLDGVTLVDNAAISAAIKDVFNESRSILEPAGAVAVAGAKAYMKHHNLQGKTVIAITSGANMNFDRLRVVADLADVGSMKEVIMVTSVPERPGAFLEFAQAGFSAKDIEVTEFKYRFAADANANILFSVGIRTRADADALMQRLNDRGFKTRDITKIAAAQTHLRHLVGGRARSYMGQLPYERIFQVQFPERVGALMSFLERISPRWNVTLFHYRNAGNRSTVVLLGIQVPPEDEDSFQAALAPLIDNEFTFSELDGEARDVFNMFIS